MPLSATLDGERIISTQLGEEEWEVLRADIKAKRRTVAMPCGWPGHARTSRLGTPFFAHNPGGDSCIAGETAEHLLAKAIIVDAARKAGWQAEPEFYGDDWVADVLASRGDVRVVFEVQWSNQQADEYERRQQRYRDAGIASVGWFARHAEHLRLPKETLPIFQLRIVEGEATVLVEGREIPLSETVERLLTRRLQFRSHLEGQESAVGTVEGAVMDCYRCRRTYGIWYLSEVAVTGRCGGVKSISRTPGAFLTQRPEALPEVIAAGGELAEGMGTTPAQLDSRYTQASGTRYMAFVCPHCNAVCGETFLAEEIGWEEHTLRTAVPAAAIPGPHWCVAGESGTCSKQPDEEVVRRYDDGASESPERAAVSRSLSTREVVHRMMGSQSMGGLYY